VEPKTSDPGKFPQLGVEDVSGAATTGTEIELAAGERRWGLIVGKASGTRESFVRALPGSQAALVQPQLTLDSSPVRWLDTALIDIRPERVKQIVATIGSAAPYTVSRATESTAELTLSPAPRGREASARSTSDAATGLAAALAGLQFDDVRAAPAATKPDAVLAVETFDGLRLSISGRIDLARRHLRIEATAAADAKPAVTTEVQQLAARTRDREFEVAEYKYAALFRPLAEIAAPLSESSTSAPMPPLPAGR
jgi:hypothetical protein